MKKEEEANTHMPTTLIYNPTINQQIRTRAIMKAENGLPMVKMPKKTFVPASKPGAKTKIKNDNFTLY